MSETPNASDAPREGALRRFRAWFALGVLYAAFFLWYTPLGGPLTEEEIARYEGVLRDLARSDPPVLGVLQQHLHPPGHGGGLSDSCTTPGE